MSAADKHRETAAEIMRRSAYRGSVACFIEDISTALATAEREGMKRAAEIASRDADWSRFGKREVHEPWEGGPDDARDYRIGIVASRAIAAAILSEAERTA